MTIEMVQLHDRLTAAEAIDRIRSSGIDDETVYTAYCIDNARHLVGTLPLHRLLFAKADSLVRDLMDDDQQLIFVSTLEDEEDVADLARKYDLLSVPVVDNEKRLVGVITIDDIVDVIEEKTQRILKRWPLCIPPGRETNTSKPAFSLGWESYRLAAGADDFWHVYREDH